MAAGGGEIRGLARSFLIAAPLLANEPEAKAAGISLAAYYRQQILLSVTPGTPNYLGGIQEILPQGQPGEKAFQHTAECASLAIGLSMCPEAVWDTCTKEEKDRIADYLSQFGHSYTGHHNWRLFNMLILAFLDREGYAIDRDVMRDHAQVIVSYYAGDGWYRDGHLFDYYCPWPFTCTALCGTSGTAMRRSPGWRERSRSTQTGWQRRSRSSLTGRPM